MICQVLKILADEHDDLLRVINIHICVIICYILSRNLLADEKRYTTSKESRPTF